MEFSKWNTNSLINNWLQFNKLALGVKFRVKICFSLLREHFQNRPNESNIFLMKNLFSPNDGMLLKRKDQKPSS